MIPVSKLEIGLLDLLVEKKDLTETNIHLLKHYVDTWRLSDFDAVLETKILTEVELADKLAEYLGVTRFHGAGQRLITDPETFGILSYEQARRFRVLPMRHLENGLRLLMANPLDKEALSILKKYQNLEILVDAVSDVESAISLTYPASRQIEEIFLRTDNER